MLSFSPSAKVFLVAGATDMRKQFDGLSGIVREEIHKNPLTGHLFVFCNRRRNRLKILFWQRGGLWVCAKRLEEGTFGWPEIGTKSVEMTMEELSLLVAGIDVKVLGRRRWYQRDEEGSAQEKSCTVFR